MEKQLDGIVYNDIAHRASLVVLVEGEVQGFRMYDIIYTSTTYKTFHLARFWRGLYIHILHRRSPSIIYTAAGVHIELFARIVETGCSILVPYTRRYFRQHRIHRFCVDTYVESQP